MASGKFLVDYLGSEETDAVRGREHTDPVAFSFILHPDQRSAAKRVLDVNGKEIKVMEYAPKKSGKLELVKQPALDLRNVSFIHELDPPNDNTVVFLYITSYSVKRGGVSSEVYRFESSDMAHRFVSLVSSHTTDPQNRAKHDQLGSMLDKMTTNRPSSDLSAGLPRHPEKLAHSDGVVPKRDYDDTDIRLSASLANELKSKLKTKDKAPLLLPPKDYDTVHRSKGNLVGVQMRRSQNRELVGDSGGVYGGEESGHAEGLDHVVLDDRPHPRNSDGFTGYRSSDPSRVLRVSTDLRYSGSYEGSKLSPSSESGSAGIAINRYNALIPEEGDFAQPSGNINRRRAAHNGGALEIDPRTGRVLRGNPRSEPQMMSLFNEDAPKRLPRQGSGLRTSTGSSEPMASPRTQPDMEPAPHQDQRLVNHTRRASNNY